MQLPYQGEFGQVAELSASLNLMEARQWMDFPQLGCWRLHSTGGIEGQSKLAHASFIPNALYSPGIATNFAFWSVVRARWARQTLWPDLTDEPMEEIFQKRLDRLRRG